MSGRVLALKMALLFITKKTTRMSLCRVQAIDPGPKSVLCHTTFTSIQYLCLLTATFYLNTLDRNLLLFIFILNSCEL